MKKFVLLFCLTGFMFSACATSPNVTEPIEYSEVVDVADVSKADLYTRVNMWFVDAFRSADSVIQFSDKESGTVKGKYVFILPAALGSSVIVRSTITTELKDGRYRISFSDPTGQAVSASGERLSEKRISDQDLADKVTAEWKNLASNLNKAVNKSTDW